MPLAPQEEATIRAFVAKERRERFLDLLGNPKRRREITLSLAHPNLAWFDERFRRALPTAQHDATSIATWLKANGATDNCWAISEDASLDGKEIDLQRALSATVGRGVGTILCCVPGKLAFVESEDSRFILQR